MATTLGLKRRESGKGFAGLQMPRKHWGCECKPAKLLGMFAASPFSIYILSIYSNRAKNKTAKASPVSRRFRENGEPANTLGTLPDSVGYAGRDDR